METADVVIVGGGIIGLSAAYHLLARERCRVVVLEREPSVGLGSTGKAGGAIRQQFSSAINVDLTRLSLPEWERFETEMGARIGFRKHGYMLLTSDPDTFASIRDSVAMQQAHGAPSRTVDAREIKELWPLADVDAVVGGSFCPEDGSANPSDALAGYLGRVRQMGGDVRLGVEAAALRVESDAGRKVVTGVQTPGGAIAAPWVINAAGPSARTVAATAGLDLPVLPYRRQVLVVERPAAVGSDWPLLVDLDTGWYVHCHRDALLTGGTDKDTDPGEGLPFDWGGVDRVLAAASRRVPALAHAGIIRGYAGTRALTPDFHAILGPVPGLDGLLLANGWSGHGFMHAPAAGLLLAEMVLDGHAHSLDINPLSIGRFLTGQLPKRPEANAF